MNLASTLNNSRLWNRHGLHLLWVFALVLLILVVLRITYSEYLNSKQKSNDYALQTLAPIDRSARAQYRASDIISANLFGDPRPQEAIKNIPKTDLNLKLIGVLWASNQEMARVIIQTGKDKAKLYSIGDDIKGASASVKEIRSNEIFLNRNGATEKLTLEKKKSSADIISYTPSNQTYTPVSASYSAPVSSVSTAKPISPNGKNRKIRKPNFSGLDRALKKMKQL